MRSFDRLCFVLAMCLSGSLAQEDGYETFPSVPGSRYKLYTIHVNWVEALSLCQGDGGGSHLVIINSDTEAGVVKEMFDRITDPATLYLHVGIDDIITEGTWVTVQGGLVSTSGYNKWAIGEPNRGTLENCGAVNRSVLFFDADCNSLMAPLVCEKPEI